MADVSKVMKKITIPPNTIPETVSFLRKAGLKGYEGRVYWLGKAANGGVCITRIVVPEQVARRTSYGVSVTVPQSANIKIARDLKPGEYIVAKIHSHPGRAFNSDVDKDNPFLRHEGSISIIVPNYGRTGMNRLSNCVVCVFVQGQWQELTPLEIKNYFCFE